MYDYLPVHCKDASEIEIRILDITGRMLQSEIRELEGGICKINTQKLVPGAYQVCVIFNDGSQKSRKFVKQN
ncbi:MAG TPA: T9SS type A sorting domain-containing protein [Bacteroidales bacterium]|nr:T9SS type A sorting domain-containing protein [Bacteroidales bacterium]